MPGPPGSATAWHQEFLQSSGVPPVRFDDLEQFELWRQAQVRDDLRRLARRYREPHAANWTDEFVRQVPAVQDERWADEFVRGQFPPPPGSAESWAREFERERDVKYAQQQQLLDEFLQERGGASDGDLRQMAPDNAAVNRDDDDDADVAVQPQASTLNTRFAHYEFASPNPYLDSPDPFDEGRRLFQNGSLAEAVLALEAAVQRAPDGIASRAAAVAWALLGQAHAENDHDDRAIACLMRAVDADNSNLDALIALGVSCTNDYYRDEALNLLETWLDQHPDYRHLAAQMPQAPPPLHASGADVWVASFEHHARVTALFLRAAALKPTAPDPHVQTALGLLYNLSYEYDRAADCFRAALSVKPDDYSLWNKLGATLANGNDSRAALTAYHRALALKPMYVRARANLGIAHLALGEFDRAAHQLSLALKRHGAAHDEHLWNNLELVCRLMENEGAALRANRRDAALLNEFS